MRQARSTISWLLVLMVFISPIQASFAGDMSSANGISMNNDSDCMLLMLDANDSICKMNGDSACALSAHCLTQLNSSVIKNTSTLVLDPIVEFSIAQIEYKAHIISFYPEPLKRPPIT